MNDFEQELREQLHRVPAPDGLAGRVMGRVARKRRARAARYATAAILVAGSITGGTIAKRHRDQQAQAQQTRQQFEQAMRITANTLDQIQAQIIQPAIQPLEKQQ